MVEARARCLSLALVCLAGAFGACDELDPVFTKDLCQRAPGEPISIHCKQCQGPTLAAGCPQCRVTDPPAECESSDMSPATMPESGSTAVGTGGEPGAPPSSSGNGSPEAGGGANPAAPSGGRGQTPGTGGSNGGGMSGPGPSNPPGTGGQSAGTGGNGASVEPSDCMCPSGAPHCRPDRVCVGCWQEAHCPGRHCEVATMYACVDCRTAADCAAPQSVCDTADHTCVQCTKPSDCAGNGMLGTCNPSTRECVDCDGDNRDCTDPSLPACFQQHCVECMEDSQCKNAPNRHCNMETHTCVPCNVREGDCSDPAVPLCIEAEHRCVQCLDKTDCHDSDYARCTSDNQCAGCNADADCSRFAATPVCDTTAHQCVQCNDTQRDCAATTTACILARHECGTRRLQSVPQCGECESSDECGTGNDCVPTTFGSARADAGYRCLPRLEAVSGTCASVRGLGTRLSTKNTEAKMVTVCSPGPLTSCVAFLKTSTRQACTSDGQCGAFSTDGSCTDAGRCSYPCRSPNECPGNLQCENNTRCNDAVSGSAM